jgi:hypothetical protein
LEHGEFAATGILPLELNQSLVHQCTGPLTGEIQEGVRSDSVLVSWLTFLGVQRNELPRSSSPFTRPLFLAFAVEEIAEGAKEEATEPAVLSIDSVQPWSFKQVLEERLGEIFGLMVIEALPAHEGVERMPVNLAKPGQGCLVTGRVQVSGGQDKSPESIGHLGPADGRRGRFRWW